MMNTFVESSESIPQAHSINPSEWKLVWQDEFDTSTIDLTKWNIRDGGPVYNNERQVYVPENVYIEDGNLVILSQRHPRETPRFTSGRLNTSGKFEQQFGFIEIRAKLPKTQGIWPAHWMLPANDDFPPEIDIVEMLGHDPNTVYMSLHWEEDEKIISDTSFYIGPDFSDDFHLFAIEWNENAIIWYIDGVERHRIETYIPQQPFYLIINTAIGGYWPGNPDRNTLFPQYHIVDYVRVYEKIPEEPTAVFSPEIYDNIR
jgi:beta-glucanase (GH16 family)